MGYYESRSEFDGFDNSNSVQAYDDKKEKRFQADIWILLSIFFVGIFLTNCYRHAHERQLLQNGTCIEAEYFEQQGRASYIDSDGKYYHFDVSGGFPVTNGDRIQLYYTDEVLEAQPQTAPAFWIACYVLFGALSAFCIWRVVCVYRKRNK